METPLLALLYTMAENYTDLFAANNSPRVNAIGERARRPQVGDFVFETSHRLGERNAHMPATLGVLLAIEHRPLYPAEEWDEAREGRPCPTEKVYVVRTLDGNQFSWTNARLMALPVCTRSDYGPKNAVAQENVESRFVADVLALHDRRVLPEVREWVRGVQATPIVHPKEK